MQRVALCLLALGLLLDPGARALAQVIPGVTRPVVVGGDRDYPPY